MSKKHGEEKGRGMRRRKWTSGKSRSVTGGKKGTRGQTRKDKPKLRM